MRKEQLLDDERVKEAKKLLLEVVREKQETITGICPPDPALEKSYAEILKQFGEYRGSPLWFPFIGAGIGKGPFVQLLDGSVKYDFISGIGVHHFGHSHPAIIESGIDAAVGDTVMQGHLQQNIDQVNLVNLLIEQSGLDHCFLTTTGAMANENGLKIALQKNSPANRILTFERAFCGRTWAMAQITEKNEVRDGLPVNLPVDYIPFYDPKNPDASKKQAITTLKKYLQRYPKQHAVMICELVQGEAGFYPGSKEFFIEIMTLLKDHDIAVQVDEVQTFGRTSKLFAFQHFGLEEYVDIVTIGKLSQVCATLYKSHYNPRPGLLSQTFTSSTQAIHAALTMIPLMLREGFFGPEGKNHLVHRQFVSRLENIFHEDPGLLCGPYGLGAMVAFTPLDGTAPRVKSFVERLYHAGVLSFICGKNPTRARFLVPVGAVSEEDIDHVCKIVKETLQCM